jgi:hypothetical protein
LAKLVADQAEQRTGLGLDAGGLLRVARFIVVVLMIEGECQFSGLRVVKRLPLCLAILVELAKVGNVGIRCLAGYG